MSYTFHYIALTHLPVTKHYSACAFTQKVHKLTRMLVNSGHKVYVYGAGYTDINHPNVEFVPVIDMDSVREAWGNFPLDNRFELGYDSDIEGFRHDVCEDIKKPCTLEFRENTIREIRRRMAADHFLLLSQGTYHRPIADELNLYLTCEPGIGYRGSYAPFRAFESNYIQYFTYGSENPYGSIDGHFYHRVIPNYFDLDDFEFSPQCNNAHLAYIGRLIRRKGLCIADMVAEALGVELLVAGQGTLAEVSLEGKKHIRHVGCLGVKERKRFLADVCIGMTPTLYIEPFGGTAVEFQLSGTPVLTTNFGAFVDTVNNGVSGYRCNTLNDFVQAAHLAKNLDRSKVRQWAEQYSMKNVNLLYEKWWNDLYQLYLSTRNNSVKGWHFVDSRRVQ